MKGIFITFEGIDGSGKTTQIKKLSQHLTNQGYSVLKTLEPGDNSVGKMLRQVILDPQKNIVPQAELFLYLADRAQHTQEVVKPALDEGKIVISDRFADATLAYQGYGRGLGLDLVKAMNILATDYLVPDLTFLLDIPPGQGRKRTAQRRDSVYKNGDRIEREKIEFHRRLRAGYLTIAENEPGRFRIIDGLKDIVTIHAIIKKETEKILPAPLR